MKVYYELDLETFDAWSGAVDTLERIKEEGKCTDLEFMLEDLYPNGMSDTELNDLLWFESEQIYEWLGIGEEEEEEEIEEIDFESIDNFDDYCNDRPCDSCYLYKIVGKCDENFDRLKKEYEENNK